MCLLRKILFVPKRRRRDDGLSRWTPSPSAGVVLTDVAGWSKEGAPTAGTLGFSHGQSHQARPLPGAE